MENASKALLIAGAILIVILLIAVGMMVYNGAKGSIDKGISSMSSTEKQIHNAQFEQYLGEKVSGSNIRNLLSAIMANNGNSENPQVSIDGNWQDAKTAYSAVNVSVSVSYKAEIAEMTGGCITKIKIIQNS